MAQKLINIGTGPNTGAADPVREAFKKVNENFTELYIALGLNSDTTLNLGAFEFTGSTMSTTDSSPITIDQATAINSSLTVSGDILPNVANGGDLGSAAKPWKSLYVSGNTIYIGGNALGLDNEGELVWNNSRIAHADGEYITLDNLTDVNANSPSPGDTIVWNGGAWVNSPAGGNADTGDVTFSGVKVIGAGTASGDGFGYSTLELVPDNNLYGNHQYLVIDPTAPSHIHIRAGGPQDGSNADLFLGGEKTYVRVRDNQGVRMQTETQQSIGYFNFNTSVGFSSAAWQDDGFGGYQIIINDPTPDVFTAVWALSNISFIQVYDGTNFTTLTANGNSGTPGGGPITFGVTQAPPSSPTAIVEIVIENFVLRTNSAEVSGSDFTVNVYDDVRITGSDVVSIRNRSATSPVTIITDWDDDEYTWSFNSDGTLNFPDGSTQTTAYTGAGSSSITNGVYTLGVTATGQIDIPTASDGKGRLQNPAGIEILTNSGETAKLYTFGSDGNLTVPTAVLTTDITNKLSPAIGGQVTGIRPPDGAGANLGYVWVPDETQISSLGDITGWTLTNSDGIFSTTVVQMRNDLGASWAIQTADPLIYTGTYTFTSPNYQASQPLPVNINVGTDTWTFNTSGNLSVPGGISSTEHLFLDANYDTGYSVYIGNEHPTPGMVGGVVIGDVRGGFVNVTTQKLIIENTAVPASSAGAPGDLAGQVAFDGSYIYYCTQNFGGTTYNVVHDLAAEFDANGVDNGYLVQNIYQLPEVGWKVYYNGQVTTINQVNSSGIPGYYVVFVDSPLVIPGQATFAWGPVPVTNIWKRVAWSGDTW